MFFCIFLTFQGKIRDKKVVHPSRCRNHLSSYYTCLSRSSNAKGTILLTEPDTNKIMKGISGYLRQEFRELYILDEMKAHSNQLIYLILFNFYLTSTPIVPPQARWSLRLGLEQKPVMSSPFELLNYIH